MTAPGRNAFASPDLSGRDNLLAFSFLPPFNGGGSVTSLPSPTCHCEERSDVAIS